MPERRDWADGPSNDFWRYGELVRVVVALLVDMAAMSVLEEDAPIVIEARGSLP